MQETTVRRFFEGQAAAADLEQDVTGSVESYTDSAGTRFSRHRITDMQEEFALAPAHLITLVDAVLDAQLSLAVLDATVFCLEASDHFVWDAHASPADRIAQALFWLGTPEINYPLTHGVLRKIRHYLVTGEKTLTERDGEGLATLDETQQSTPRAGA
jgi:hypothetical protein